MEPLHGYYHNLGAWKTVRAESVFSVYFDTEKIKNNGYLSSVSIFLLGFGVWYFLPKNDFFPWVFLIGGLASALCLVGYTFSYTREKDELGAIFCYEIQLDTATFSEGNKVITNAKNEIFFSYEVYNKIESCNVELNYVIEGKRYPFLSALDNGTLKKLADELEAWGFVVHVHKIEKSRAVG